MRIYLILFLFSIFGFSQITTDISRKSIAKDIRPQVLAATQINRTDPATLMDHMVMVMRVHNNADLELLMTEQQDIHSPQFHRWLTPSEFEDRFAPSLTERQKVITWLNSQGFIVDPPIPGGLFLTFSGSVSSVEAAFQTNMSDVQIEGHIRHANVTIPSIPQVLESSVEGILSLHNIPLRTCYTTTDDSAHFLAPGDFATIYNLIPLYAQGVSGLGQSIAVIGRCNIDLNDVRSFRNAFGLTPRDPTVIVNGEDPGNVGGGEELEALLDVEWSGAIAYRSHINFIVSASTNSTDGVFLSALYAVTNNISPIMTVSFGAGEEILGLTETWAYSNLWRQAAIQGITVCVASGDSGSAGNYPFDFSPAVNGLASSPFNVCVGGTTLNDSFESWNTYNSVDGSSAIGYIPEVVWNESGKGATGGGASAIFGKPIWQICPGIIASTSRYCPDISLSAAVHDAYMVYDSHLGGMYSVGGTSASSPAFAGILACIEQANGSWQGNILPQLYKLGNAQYTGLGPAVFHDITSGNNAFLGVSGYSATIAYDMASGLGSIDASALSSNWIDSPITATSISTLASPQSSGCSITFTISCLGGSGAYEYQFWSRPSGGDWIIQQPYSTNAIWTWNTTGLSAGSYDLTVWVKSAGTNPSGGYDISAYTYSGGSFILLPPVTAVVSANGPSPQTVGQLVTFTVAASGGSGAFNYQFYIQLAGGPWIMQQAYSNSASWTWNTSSFAVGNYTISVWVRNAGSTIIKDKSSFYSYTLVPSITLINTPSIASPQTTGASIVFTAAASGGTNNFEFRFWTLSPGASTWILQRDWSNVTTWTWNTSGLVAGGWRISVWVRCAGAAPIKGFDTSAIVDYVLRYPPIIISGTASAPSVTFSLTASGGSGSYEYQFWMQPPGGSLVITQVYSNTKSWSWITSGASTGTYNVTIWVRSVGTTPTVGYDATVTIPYVLNAK